MLLTDQIGEQITPHPSIGQSVVEAGQTIHLLVENPARPGIWWAWNPTTSTFEQVTPPDEMSEQRSDPNTLLQAVATSHGDLQQRLQTAERHVNRLQSTIGQIRDYAVERHEAGDICLQGTQEFLSTFDMDPFPQQVEVNVTVHGTASINASDVESALSRIRFLIDGFDYSGDEENEAVEFYLGSVEVEPRES